MVGVILGQGMVWVVGVNGGWDGCATLGAVCRGLTVELVAFLAASASLLMCCCGCGCGRASGGWVRWAGCKVCNRTRAAWLTGAASCCILLCIIRPYGPVALRTYPSGVFNYKLDHTSLRPRNANAFPNQDPADSADVLHVPQDVVRALVPWVQAPMEPE